MNFEDLTPEQQAKARACTSPEELLALAMSEGVELSDAELEQVVGGSFAGWMPEGFDPASVWGNLPTGSTH